MIADRILEIAGSSLEKLIPTLLSHSVAATDTVPSRKVHDESYTYIRLQEKCNDTMDTREGEKKLRYVGKMRKFYWTYGTYTN
jgi:hypothetical protein